MDGAFLYVGLWQLVAGAPAVLEFEYEAWENRSFGFHNIERTTARGTIAISADGSRANNVRATSYALYFWPAGEDWQERTIYSAPEQRGYRIDVKEGKVYSFRLRRNPDPPNADCVAEAARLLGDELGEPRYLTVDRVRVVRFSWGGSASRREADFALDHGCQVMRSEETHYNSIFLPTSSTRFRVTKYTPGEPSRDRFVVPAGVGIIGGQRHDSLRSP